MDDPYILARGSQATERLLLQNELIFNNAKSALEKAGIGKGVSIFDIGCGIGAMLDYLVDSVTEAGKVMALDISQEQLIEAEKRMKEIGIHDINFIHSDIESNNLLDFKNTGDICYSRFMLMHLRNPVLAVKNIYDLLKIGGRFVSQESILAKAYRESKSEIMHSYYDILLQIGKQKSVDFSIGDKVPEILKENNFAIEAYYEPENDCDPSKMKTFHLEILKESRKSIIDTGIQTNEEFESLFDSMLSLDATKEHFTYPNYTITIARKD